MVKKQWVVWKAFWEETRTGNFPLRLQCPVFPSIRLGGREVRLWLLESYNKKNSIYYTAVESFPYHMSDLHPDGTHPCSSYVKLYLSRNLNIPFLYFFCPQEGTSLRMHIIQTNMDTVYQALSVRFVVTNQFC